MTSEAVILAGGLGNRLKTIVSDRPKPMADINGRPFLVYLCDYLIRQGIDRIILSVGYKHEFIRNYFGDRYKQTDLIYAVEEEPLGTGGGLRNALTKVTGKTAFVVNGDTFFGIPLLKMEELFRRNNADLQIALCRVKDQRRYGTVRTDRRGRILEFAEKTEKEGTSLINGGVYLMKRGIFEDRELPCIFSFEKDFLEKSTGSLRMFGKPFAADFIDIGIPETLQQAKFLLRKQVFDLG